MASLPLSFLTVIICFVSASLQSKDPLQDFCRRFGHQTTVIDDKLYIDGGLLNWNPISTYPQNYSNTWLLYQDLEQNGASGMPLLHANLSKNASVPDVSGGILWGDDVNKRIYLFGGEYYDDPPTSFNLYSYDVLNNWWDNFGLASGTEIEPVSYGAGVGISELGLGFYYGGWLSNNSVSGWSGPRLATTGLIRFDMDQHSWTNNSGPDSIRRAGGSMNYIPASDGGMLIYFGGIQDPHGNGSAIGQPMNEIFIYDIFTGQWYKQNTTGTTPQMRQNFCSGVTWADDQSSYNIYLYGGAGVTSDTAGYDDVYILTMPTFTWIKIYPDSSNTTGQYPHHSLSCNVINRGQMLIIGGTFPLSDGCDAAPQWGTHNLVLGQQSQSDASPWELYSPDLTTYAVPDKIISVVGGQRTGGATMTTPSGGFDNSDLKVLMTKTATAAARTPTRFIPGGTGGGVDGDSNLSKGAKAGIAVGSAAAAIAALSALLFLVRRYRRSRYGSASPGARGAGGGGGWWSGTKSSAGGSSGNYAAYGAAPGNGTPPWSPQSVSSAAAAAANTTTSAGAGAGAGGDPYSPSSYGGPPTPFTRRPSNINIQQGPVELPAIVPDPAGAVYELPPQGRGGGEEEMAGAGGVVSKVPRALKASGRSASTSSYGGRPKFDDSGRPWYPQVGRMDDGLYPLPRLPSYHGDGGGARYGPARGGQDSPSSPAAAPGRDPLVADPQEMSAEPKGSESGWEGGGSGTSWLTGMGTGTRRGSESPSAEEREEWVEGRHGTFYNP